MPIGAHMSIRGGVRKAPGRGAEVGCEALQIFTRSNVRWSFPDLGEEEARAFRESVRQTGLKPVIAHGCYLVNLASADSAVRRKSYAALLDEIRRCRMLGIVDLVIHPGSHPAGAGEAIKLICESLNRIFDETADARVRVLLETTAGQGRQVGRRFEELRRMIDLIELPERIGVCVDTCHIFAAGYDVRTAAGYRKTFDEFCKVVGRRHLRAFHLNDCKSALGSCVDRHEHIGRGRIGTRAFGLLLGDPRFRRLPKIIETPKSDEERDDWDAANISLLKRLRAKALKCPAQPRVRPR